MHRRSTDIALETADVNDVARGITVSSSLGSVRLAQLVMTLPPPDGPPFYVEDDVMEERIDRVAAGGLAL